MESLEDFETLVDKVFNLLKESDINFFEAECVLECVSNQLNQGQSLLKLSELDGLSLKVEDESA